MLKLYYRYHDFRKQVFARYPSAASFASLAAIVVWVLIFKSMVLSANNIPTGSMIPTLKIGDFLFVNRMRYGIHLPFTDINLLQIGKPDRGDIVVFTPPPRANLEGKTLVKRLIGMPGDEIVVKDDEIYVNNVHYPVEDENDRTILNDLDYPNINRGLSESDLLLFREKVIDPYTKEVKVEHFMLKTVFFKDADLSNPPGVFKVPPKKYMLMGDNRDDSDDSRRWEYVDEDQIHGKVFMIYFSVNWGSRFHDSEAANPFTNLFRLFGGKLKNASVRWNRIGDRIY